MNFKTSLSFAKEMDEIDPLKDFRKQFIFPSFHKNQIRYFTGNSLGLQPITTREIIGEELDDWAHLELTDISSQEDPGIAITNSSQYGF